MSKSSLFDTFMCLLNSLLFTHLSWYGCSLPTPNLQSGAPSFNHQAEETSCLASFLKSTTPYAAKTSLLHHRRLDLQVLICTISSNFDSMRNLQSICWVQQYFDGNGNFVTGEDMEYHFSLLRCWQQGRLFNSSETRC